MGNQQLIANLDFFSSLGLYKLKILIASQETVCMRNEECVYTYALPTEGRQILENLLAKEFTEMLYSLGNQMNEGNSQIT